MYKFDENEFNKINDIDKKVEYIENSEDETIELHNVEYDNMFSRKYDKLSKENIPKLIRKRFSENNNSLLNHICLRENMYSDDYIIKLLDIYKQNNWFTRPYEKAIIHDIFTRNDPYKVSYYGLTDKLFRYTLDLYNELNIDINGTGCWRNKGSLLNTILKYGDIHVVNELILYYIEKDINFDEDKAELLDMVLLNMKTNKIEKTSRFDNLIKLGIDNLPDSFYSSDKFIITLMKIKNCTNNFELIDFLISKFDDCKDDKKFVNVLNYELEKFVTHCKQYKHINSQLLKFIINLIENVDNYKAIIKTIPTKLEYYQILFNAILTMNDMDLRIKSNLLIDLLKQSNYKIKNDTISIYVPHTFCINGETTSCNYRNITLNFYLIVKYGVTFNSIVNDCKSKKYFLLKSQNPVSPYELYNPIVDSSEVYDSPAFILKKNFMEEKKEICDLSFNLFDIDNYSSRYQTYEHEEDVNAAKSKLRESNSVLYNIFDESDFLDFIKNIEFIKRKSKLIESYFGNEVKGNMYKIEECKFPYIYRKDLHLFTDNDKDKLNMSEYIPPVIINCEGIKPIFVLD